MPPEESDAVYLWDMPEAARAIEAGKHGCAFCFFMLNSYHRYPQIQR